MSHGISGGREQAKTTATAQAHTPDLSRWYGHALPPAHPGDYEFRLTLLRPKLAPVPLQHMVESFGWVDEQSVMTGNLTARRPDLEEPQSLPVTRGDLIRCEVRWAQTIYRLWTMRVQPVQTAVESGELTVALQDDLALLDSTALDWFFRKSKAKPSGYTADEVTLEVARRLGVALGQLSRATQRFALVKRHTSGLAVLKAAWMQEKAATGVGYVIRLRNGKLEVVPIRRNPLLYVLKDQIQTAMITEKNGQSVPTTVLEGHGHVGKGKGSQKVSYTAYDRSVVSRLGYVHRVKQYGQVSSPAELRAKVKADYAAGIRTNALITIQHTGIPFIQRGDGVQVPMPSEGYGGARAFVYCTRAVHTVQAGTYQSEWDFTAVDPYLAELEAERKAAKQRAAKRARRTGLSGGGGG